MLFAGIYLVMSGIGILVLVFAGRAGKSAVALIVAGVGVAALGIWLLAARRVHTTIDAEGVRTSSMFGRHSCRWSEVTDVDLDIDATDGSPMVWSIKIHRAGRFWHVRQSVWRSQSMTAVSRRAMRGLAVSKVRPWPSPWW
jgi:Bacterial PH domain